MLAVLIAVGLAGGYAAWAMRRPPTCAVAIRLEPSGEASVTFRPHSLRPDQLVRLALVYGAKIRWLLLNEPHGATDTFRAVVEEAINSWSSLTVQDLRTDTWLRQITAGAAGAAAPNTVPGGEEFRLRYFEGSRGAEVTGWVVNTLPRPGLSANIPWHFLHVLQAVRARLSQEDRRRSEVSLQLWRDAIFGPSASDRSMAGLKILTNAANHAVAVARFGVG